MVLVIIGDNTSANHLIKTGKYPIEATTKIGAILLVVTFVVVLLITSWLAIRCSHAESRERILGVAVALSMTFFVVRLVYLVLILFYNKGRFSVLSGDAALFGIIVVMPELVVIILYEGVGVKLPKLPKKVQVQGGSRLSRGRDRLSKAIQRLRGGRSPGKENFHAELVHVTK
jgi:hypothetical protein